MMNYKKIAFGAAAFALSVIKFFPLLCKAFAESIHGALNDLHELAQHRYMTAGLPDKVEGFYALYWPEGHLCGVSRTQDNAEAWVKVHKGTMIPLVKLGTRTVPEYLAEDLKARLDWSERHNESLIAGSENIIGCLHVAQKTLELFATTTLDPAQAKVHARDALNDITQRLD